MKRFASRALLVAFALVACDMPTSPLKTTAVGPPNARMAGEVTNAVYTIVNDSADGPGTCYNGPIDNIQNCNIYAAKENVWLGGKSIHGTNGLDDGTYFFAVLQPGGQQDPNDGYDHVLSDPSPTTNTGAGDTYENRTFTLDGGVIHYEGTHSFGSNKIRLFGYDDTPNPGGEYIMAVCSLGSGYPVDPSKCKYDAFKVKVSDTPPPCTENCEPPPPTPAFALTATKTAAGMNDRTYKWSISKDVDKTLLTSANGSATFNYTVTATRDDGTPSNIHVAGSITVNNPNDGAVAIAGITDVLSDGTPCSVLDAPTTMAPGSTTVLYSCDLGGLPSEALNNTATISWSAQQVNGHPLAEGSATASANSIEFTEKAIDASVSLTDTYGDLGSASATTPFTYAKTFADNAAGTCTAHDNTATFATSDTHATGSASQSVKVCVGANLTASKTAAPSFTRTYAWGISKSVDKTVVKQVGGSATFTYSVSANQTGNTDSNWLVSGTITVNNPNDWEAVTTDISDAIDNGGSCAISGGSSVTIPASSSVTRDYTCSYASAPSASYTNTATASWDGAAAATPGSEASGTALGAFGAPTTLINSSVSVQDNFNGSSTTLGSLTASDGWPASGNWSYSHTLAVVANTCNTYNNTAGYMSNDGATGSASQSVMVCGNVAGGLTKGFWQNKNGQGIISSGLSTSGVCNSATWLRQYAPFANMTATTCAQVASYALSIIKAADASGASMNAMLKAQMLATAFDVYFSTSSLGGNKILAPAPLGGIKVDLTMVCPVIGTTCSGGYRSSSAAFGGATAMTVSDILAYAASQSNAGGTSWYGQVKGTQEMAKNVFDAINNAVALVSP